MTHRLAIALLLLASIATSAQTTASPPSQQPAFDVATIKPNKSSNCTPIIRPMGDGIRATCVTLLHLIFNAYGPFPPPVSPILGAPDWASFDRFDLEAKIDSSATDNLRKLGLNEQDRARGRMLQTLLADRFKLAIHKETREGPAYALIVAKNGPKLKPGTPLGPSYAGITTGILRPVGGSFVAQDVSMERLAPLLALKLDRPVIDKTGLTGRYDFTLDLAPDQAPAPMSSVSGDSPQGSAIPIPDASDPSIFTAVQEQLGLKLEPAKAPVEVLVIDHIEQPSEN